MYISQQTNEIICTNIKNALIQNVNSTAGLQGQSIKQGRGSNYVNRIKGSLRLQKPLPKHHQVSHSTKCHIQLNSSPFLSKISHTELEYSRSSCTACGQH